MRLAVTPVAFGFPPGLATSSPGLEFGAADTCRIKSGLLAVRHLTLYQVVRSDRQLPVLCLSVCLSVSLNQSINQSIKSVHSRVILDPRLLSLEKYI